MNLTIIIIINLSKNIIIVAIHWLLVKFCLNSFSFKNPMLYTKKCRAVSCYHCLSFPCLQVPAFQKGSGGESCSVNFHIWLLLEKHVEQLTGWCNPIRPHSYACYHHSAVTALSLHSEGRAAQVNTCTQHQTHYTHSTTSSIHLTCSTNMSTKHPSQSLPDRQLDTTLLCKKRQTTSQRHACMHVNA